MERYKCTEMKREIVMMNFEKSAMSMNSGTFALFCFEHENDSLINYIVEIYSNGISHANKGYISVKISTTAIRKSELQCTLSVIDNENKHTLLRSASCIDGHHRLTCLFERFVEHRTLIERKDEVLQDDALVVCCEITHGCDFSVESSDLAKYGDEVVIDDKINILLPIRKPYKFEIPTDEFRDIHENLILESEEYTVKIDNVDKDILLEFFDYLCSGSSEEQDIIFDLDLDSEALRYAEYANKIKAMTYITPGMLGLAYLNKFRRLRSTVRRLAHRIMIELFKKLRHIYIYSVPASMQSSSTLTPEFLTFKSRARLHNLRDALDLLKLYVTAYKYDIDIVREYVERFLDKHLCPENICLLQELMDDYDDLTMYGVKEDGLTEFPERAMFTCSDPVSDEEILSSSDESSNSLLEEGFIRVDRARLRLQERMEFYN